MKDRSVSAVLTAQTIDMEGIAVKQAFPTQKIENIDPFLLLHHVKTVIPNYINPVKAGFAPHPHRGFSPVTFVFEGGVHHRDSRGNNSIIYEGGVQWMNSGMGIMHSERPPHDIQNFGGKQELVQLWINTPRAHKMDQPQYFPIASAEIPFIKSDDELIEVKIVAGELSGIKGSIQHITPINAYVIKAEKNGKMQLELPSNHNAFLYLLNGQLRIAGLGLVDAETAIKFNNDGKVITIEAIKDLRAIIMTGEPINEPIVAHGPFVMNYEGEILEAMRDYRMGKMGILIED
ncbi:pirin family protein [Solitalea lacus]|uniref:pirin family protein n=1 Tax=Solitalea lacus TaxID=2911172 RepID=UPI001EDC4857|nr:pirin family protein [Solitalea lacus]UKJ08459.1 pirin family protein [Solitalea lacus]